MKLAITGGTGFIGKRIILKRLALGDELACLTREKSNLSNEAKVFFGDLLNPSLDLKKFVDNADVLYHCAAEVYDESRMYDVNVLGMKSILKALSQIESQKKFFHWIQLSSCGAYGVENYKNTEIEITENTPTSPQSTYEITKTLADELIVEFAKKHDWFKYTIIRPTIVFGDGMRSKAIQRLIKLIKIRIFFYVDDKQAVANYVHVDDVVNAIDLCIMNEKAFNQIFIVSNDCPLKDFVNAIAKSINVRYPLLVVKKIIALKLVGILNFFGFKSIKKEQIDVLSRKVHFSSSKIRNAVGWKPQTSVPEQVEKMISKMS
jgi:nucleoside-diphosphate-sugar epimerase